MSLSAIQQWAAALAVDCMHSILRGDERLTITVNGKGKRPIGFPRGELLSVGTDGSNNYSVCPLKVMAWIHSATKGGRAVERVDVAPKGGAHD